MSNNQKGRNLWKNFFYLLGLLLAAAICYLSILMISGQFSESRSLPEADGIAPLQAGQSADIAALQEAFGAPLPWLEGYRFQGQAANVTFNGLNVRKITQLYEGFTLTSLRPAFASPLLLHGDLALSMETDFTVAGLPAALASKGTSHCLYFQTDDAAYSLYAENASRESFLALAERIAFAKE